MCDDTSEDKDTVDGQREKKQVEVAVVAPPDTVAHPRTVVVEPI